MNGEDLGGMIQAAADKLKPQVIAVQHADRNASVLLIPSGMDAHDVTKWTDANLVKPLRKKGTMTAGDLASFIALTLQHKQANSIVLMSTTTGSATGILNFHGAGVSDQDHGDLKTKYDPAFSTEWSAWTSMMQRASIPTKDFAKFVDEHIDDIGPAPVKEKGADANTKRLLDLAKLHHTDYASPEELLLLSRGMKINVGGVVTEIRNPTTGEVTAQFGVEHQDDKGKPMKVPGLFMLQIPVFDRGAAYALPVRLRYNIDDGKVNWSIAIINKDKALADAIEDVRGKIASETGLPTWYGSASVA